jgi:hypothetical protein
MLMRPDLGRRSYAVSAALVIAGINGLTVTARKRGGAI